MAAEQYAQNYQFENYTVDDGLSDNRITCFMKDKTGYMWIGTENGLNRFDGHSFTIYNPGTPKRYISNPYINDIEQDESGKLWIATQSGLNVIDLSTDSTHVFVPDDSSYLQKETSISSSLVWDTYITGSRVWMATDMRDLCYYDIKENKFIYFPWRKFMLQLFPGRRNTYTSIRKIYYKSPDELWLGTSAGLFSFTISTQKFYYHNSRESDHFIQLQQTPDKHNIYFIQDPGSDLQFLSLLTGEKKNIAWSSIPEFNIENISTTDPSKILWLPAGKDILEINAETGLTTKISHRIDDANSLPGGIIKTVYRENTGPVWIGTNHGIGNFNPAMHLFNFTKLWSGKKEDNNSENDLFRINHDVHTVFYSKEDDRYYISSPKNNCLLIFDRKSGKKEIITKINGIPLISCSVIFEDSKGILWILTKNNAFQYYRSQKKFVVFDFKPSPANQLCTDMAEDSEGNLWFACFNDGLYRYHIQKRKIERMTDQHEFHSALPTSLCFQKNRNSMWIGTFGNGVYEYDCDQHRFNSSIKKYEIVHSSLINDIAIDSSGRILIATYSGGISIFSTSKDSSQLNHITTTEGLPENNIYSLVFDKKGDAWATHFKGISRITKDGKILNYDKRYGLSFSDFYSPFSISNEGTIFTGINNGFLSFVPDRVDYKSPEFPLVITSVKLRSGEEIKPGKIPLALTYLDNEIQFNFAALNYSWPSANTYEYFLEGVDAGWIKSGNLNNARYNNLQPGNYFFKVKAFDFTGKQSSTITSFAFSISPPWWKTWWFTTFLLIGITGLIVYLYKQRITAIKNKATIRLQIATLKEQALRAQMNPHFIFNSLNAIQELIITEDYTASYTYLAKFSKLLRMVLDLSEKNMVPLESEIELNRLYIELESLRFKHSFHYAITVDKKIDTNTTMFPTMLLQPLIENAIWHGLMQKNGEKQLLVHFREKESVLVCIIKDNGIGRQKAAEIKLNKIGSAHFSSKGISLVRERMETLRMTGMQQARIEVTDLYDKDGNATGTQIELFISSPENNHQ